MELRELPGELEECIAFHGHLCPGLVIGYSAAKLGMRELGAHRAGDEELITIVENDTCAVDAIQVLTGCTFGKGNLFFRDYGKMAFTFATRSTGDSVRLRLHPIDLPEAGTTSQDQYRRSKIAFMLDQELSALFELQKGILTSLPSTAKIHENALCDRCGETVMSKRLRRHGDNNLCIPCDQETRKEHKTHEPGIHQSMSNR